MLARRVAKRGTSVQAGVPISCNAMLARHVCFHRSATSCRPGGVLFPRRSVARRSVARRPAARRPVGGRDAVESLMLSTSSLITSPRSPLCSCTFEVVSAVTRTSPSRSGRAASPCPWQRARRSRCSCRSTSCRPCPRRCDERDAIEVVLRRVVLALVATLGRGVPMVPPPAVGERGCARCAMPSTS